MGEKIETLKCVDCGKDSGTPKASGWVIFRCGKCEEKSLTQNYAKEKSE